MRNTLAIPSLVLALAGTALCGTAFAEEELKLEGRCALTYKTSVNAEGPCSVLQKGPVVAVKGTVEENGQKYNAVIDNNKGEGVLIGAGTFTLADGKLEKNEEKLVSWPNGYVLKIDLK